MFLRLIPIALGVLFLVGSFVAWDRGYRSPGLHKLAVLAGSGLIWLGMVMACIALLSVSTPAQAQEPIPTLPTVCGPAAMLTDSFARNLGERPIGGGTVGPRHALMVLASKDGATWSIFAVQAETGQACLIAKGNDWDPGVLPGEGG